VAKFVSQLDLEIRITVSKTVECFDDDGDGKISTPGDQANLATVLADADDVGEGILLRAFSREQINKLSTDRQVRRAVSGIAAQFAGERRSEWLNAQTGKGPFDAMGARGRAQLESMAAAEIRSRVEATTAGENPTTAAAYSTGDPHFIVSRDPNNPNDRYGPGGF